MNPPDPEPSGHPNRSARVPATAHLGGAADVAAWADGAHRVDEQSDQSFPASDPPSWSGLSLSVSSPAPDPGDESAALDGR